MRFGKGFLCLLTALFVLAAVFVRGKEDAATDFLSVDVPYGETTENITCWVNGNDYYLYLPGSVELSRMRLRYGGDGDCALDGAPVTDRMDCSQLQLNREYRLTEDAEELGTLTLLRSENVGTLFVDLASGNADHIHAAKSNRETGTLRLYTEAGQLCHQGVVTVNGRGNSTWQEEKKSYSLELASEGDLLGMGSGKKWILLSNVYDLSNLKNKLVYDFAADLGLAYSPDSDWVDLYLNGEYYGLYLLCERNEVHANRVDISANDSFLVSRDAQWRFEEQGRPFLTTESQAALRIYHSGMPFDTLQQLWQSAENAILRQDGVDPVTGKTWDQLIDRESWVKKYLIEEVFANTDGTTLSQFYYYDGSDGTGKIFAGPVWDYDLTMDVDQNDPVVSASRFYANLPGIYGSGWPDALYRKADFYSSLTETYETEFLPLLEQYMEQEIPAMAQKTRVASDMNASRWGFPGPDRYVEEMTGFLELRMEFLRDIWVEGTPYCRIDAIGAGQTKVLYMVKQGALPPAVLAAEAGGGVWYDAVTGEAFDLTAPVLADAELILGSPKAEEAPVKETVLPETEPEETVEEEKEDAAVESISLSRILPLLLFVCALLFVTAAGIWQIFRDKER